MIQDHEEIVLAVAATFTSEPLKEPLSYWMQELGFSAQVRLAPYGQVFQPLLDASGLFLTNTNGLNVLLMKLDDWTRFRPVDGDTVDSLEPEIERKAEDLVAAVKSATRRSAVPYLMVACPLSPATLKHTDVAAAFSRLEAATLSELYTVDGVYCVSSSALVTTYRVPQHFDALSDREAHVPFTPAFYTAMATFISRRLFALRSKPYKAIVLDCDQTLWRGICGEEDIDHLRIDPPYRGLQEFMVTQHRSGMMLCVCSKNNEPDVLDVFDRHSDMVLRRDHITAWRLNWKPKSENLRSIAEELNIGLDSLVFLDDNPIECAEIRAECPGVLTLQLPPLAQDIPRFLKHVWAFDHLKITEEDRARNRHYRQNVARSRFAKRSLTFSEFLAGLCLDVRIWPMASSDVPRVAQLTARTNQFNFTTVRRTDSEMRQIHAAGDPECLVVRVNDRFGDYGLVGAVMFTTTAEAVVVDTFLLSCRVLGRGVEHRMLGELGRIAQQRGVSYVDIRLNQTGRNQPALDFLNGLEAESKQVNEKTLAFRLAAGSATAVTFDPKSTFAHIPSPTVSVSDDGADETPPASMRSNLLATIVEERYDVQQILKDMEFKRQAVTSAARETDDAQPRTVTEKSVCEIWRGLLRRDRVGVHQNFFDMGGHSLLATLALSRIYDTFGIELSIQDILEAPTIAEVAAIVDTRRIERAEPERVLNVLKELDGLTDDQIDALLATETERL